MERLTQICQEIRNYFLKSAADIHTGNFTISGGQLQGVNFLKNGQYFRVVNSDLNDGVWQYPAEGLKDESFSGAVWAMAVPPAVIALAAEIDDWIKANSAIINSPYQSESFGPYSYSVKSGGGSNGVISWKSQFAPQLNAWRRINVL